MGNSLDKSCSRENENTHFVFSNFFSFENRTVYEIMPKNTMENEVPQMSQYGAYALHTGLAMLYAGIRMQTPMRLDAHMHVCTHAHAHVDQKVIVIAFPRQQ